MANQMYQYTLAVLIRKILPPAYKNGVEKQETLGVPSLKNNHEEADDRIFYHLNHSIKDESFQKVVIASAVTYVFVCAIYHYNRWVYRGLKEMWFISGKNDSLTAFPIHQLTEKLGHNVVDILPGVHALTGTFNVTIAKVSWIINRVGYFDLRYIL